MCNPNVPILIRHACRTLADVRCRGGISHDRGISGLQAGCTMR